MSTISPQRCLNRQSVYQNLSNELYFINSLRLSEIQSILQKTIPLCQKCKIKHKNHYCMQSYCKNKHLLCINCDIKSIKGMHYLHDFTFVVPLLSENVFQNFNRLKQDFRNFNNCVKSQIEKINEYLKNLQKIKGISDKQLENLDCFQVEGKYKQFSKQLKAFLNDIKKRKNEEISQVQTLQGLKLEDIFKKVNFISEQQCQLKQQQMRKQLSTQLQKLTWLKNPQTLLTQILSQNNNYNSSQNDHQRDVYISSKKKITINQIDNFFRNYNEVFTENLQHHKVEVKIQSELLNKSKFYEAFIYHFKECQKIIIDNANISHLRTPLSFRKLKELQFNCNVQTDSLATSRVQNQNEQLESFTIRKFRQQDIKILKFITGSCKKLKNLHIQFFNKSDLTHSKQLIQYLNQQSQKDLNKIVLKIRTQNQVKRLYGYLSKFYKQTSDNAVNLSQTVLEMIRKNKNLTKIVVEGIKNMDSQAILKSLFEMKYLMQYRIYYENIDLMTELDNELNKILQVKAQKKRRIFASLTKMSKDKYYPCQILHNIAQEFLI